MNVTTINNRGGFTPEWKKQNSAGVTHPGIFESRPSASAPSGEGMRPQGEFSATAFPIYINKQAGMSPIHYFWVGERFTAMELLTFRSCHKQQHQPVVWCYEAIHNAPPYVTLANAADLLPRETFEHYRDNLQLPLANISDIFRYALLHEVGGYYSDTDVIIMRNLDTIPEEEFFCSTFEYGWGECANGCFMKIKAGSQAARALVAECQLRLAEIEARGRNDIHYCHLWPFVVQKCAGELPVKTLGYDYFNPISWKWVKELIVYKKPNRKFLLKTKIRKLLPRFEARGYGLTKNTYAIHLCNEMWKQNGIDKDAVFHAGCLYQKIRMSLQD